MNEANGCEEEEEEEGEEREEKEEEEFIWLKSEFC